jgi:hypothetical protein
MKKILIALAAAGTLAAGASAAQAKVNFDIHLGGFGYNHGYYGHAGYYAPQCFWKKVKIVKWVYGEKVVVWKKKRICHDVYYGY